MTSWRKLLRIAPFVGAALLALSACTSGDEPAASDEPGEAASNDTSVEQDDADSVVDSDGEVASDTEASGDDNDDVQSSVTTTDGEDIRSEVEVRVREILPDYDGQETDEGTRLTIPSHVLFDFDEHRLRTDAQDALDEIVEVLDYYDDAPVAIVGHTDSQGPADYNQGLSERRAESVAGYIVDTGVSDARLTVSGRGEADPVASNDTSRARAATSRWPCGVA